MSKKTLMIGILALIGIVVSGVLIFTGAKNSLPIKADDTGASQTGIENTVKAGNQFALDFYADLKDREPGENIFFSPYSIFTALAMTYEGARNKTAEEMQAVFHFTENPDVLRPSLAAIYNKLNKKDTKYKLHTANALWVQKDYQILKEFIEAAEKYYVAKSANVDFKNATEEARKKINSWVESKTNDKIKDLFPPGSLTPLTRLVLTNAIYFKGNWEIQFDKSKTREEEFRVSKDKKIKTPIMSRADDASKFNYAATDKLQILEMLYEGEALSMMILLPRKDALESLEKELTLENLNKWRNKLKKQQVEVYIPKFAFDSKYFLSQNLSEMGMPSAFTRPSQPGGADFSGISGRKDLYISSVIHQAFVDVNEEGTEAAAATGVVMSIDSAVSVPVFRADHPFIFLIQERESGNILFMGRVVNPAA